jgi:hypothetical protein
MKMKLLLSAVGLLWIIAGCNMVKSMVKSSIPYTADLTIPASSEVGVTRSVISTAYSFDQNFALNGISIGKVSEVSVISAKIEPTTPADYNLGNLAWAKIYVSKADGKNEVLVASRTDISATTGNTLILDAITTQFLDQYVREKDIRIRMAYQLRNKLTTDVSVHLVLGINAYPGERNYRE